MIRCGAEAVRSRPAAGPILEDGSRRSAFGYYAQGLPLSGPVGGRRGSTSRKFVVPSEESTSRSPPGARTISLAMKSPSPSPSPRDRAARAMPRNDAPHPGAQIMNSDYVARSVEVIRHIEAGDLLPGCDPAVVEGRAGRPRAARRQGGPFARGGKSGARAVEERGVGRDGTGRARSRIRVDGPGERACAQGSFERSSPWRSQLDAST